MLKSPGELAIRRFLHSSVSQLSWLIEPEGGRRMPNAKNCPDSTHIMNWPFHRDRFEHSGTVRTLAIVPRMEQCLRGLRY